MTAALFPGSGWSWNSSWLLGSPGPTPSHREGLLTDLSGHAPQASRECQLAEPLEGECGKCQSRREVDTWLI